MSVCVSFVPSPLDPQVVRSAVVFFVLTPLTPEYRLKRPAATGKLQI